jgi:hypothetical protein
MTDDALAEDDLDDLEKVANWATGAALWSTDWTAETILSQLLRGNIDLNPSFQRRSAWNVKKQSLFIESLILGLPIPQLVLADTKGKRGAFIVIDGKQRLLAIRKFSAKSGSADEFEALKLQGLKERKDLNGKTYADLVNDPALLDDLSAYQNAGIRTVVIRNWESEAYLYEVFLRINTGSVQLSPQELRQALHPGPFSTFVETASAESPELREALNLKAPDFRMRDAEILLRYIAYKNYIKGYSGNLKIFLDDATKTLTKDWVFHKDTLVSQVEEMGKALSFTQRVFKKSGYLRKWSGQRFESRKNRAVFDIMLHYFSEESIRNSISEEKWDSLVERFKVLCTGDAEFLSSLESTTKSIVANRKRFNTWGSVVAEFSGMNLDHLMFPA